MLTFDAARKLALSLPEVEEKDHFGSPSFRIRGKIFAQLSAPDKDELRAILKLSVADQTALSLSDPEVFSSVPAWGRHGWTCVQLDGIDAPTFGGLLRTAWMLVAPKKLAASSKIAPGQRG